MISNHSTIDIIGLVFGDTLLTMKYAKPAINKIEAIIIKTVSMLDVIYLKVIGKSTKIFQWEKFLSLNQFVPLIFLLERLYD